MAHNDRDFGAELKKVRVFLVPVFSSGFPGLT
jgi:hypothetical protein